MTVNRNEVKVSLKPSGAVQMKFTLRDSYGSVKSRFQVSVPRRQFERALRDATITAPWKDLVR